jgi:hypothetical protein
MGTLNTATILSLITSIAIPGVSALLAKHAAMAGVLSPILATASGFLSEWAAAPGHYDWKAGALTAVISYGVAVAAHYGLWKGTTYESSLLKVGSNAAPAPPGT